MQYAVYSVRDILNGFGAPMCDHNDKTASRNFRIAFRGATGSDPRDYDLFRVAHFDTDTGEMIPEVSPVLVCRGIDCVSNEVSANG